jgi:thiol-disulfide isomerase/thioredoxin
MVLMKSDMIPLGSKAPNFSLVNIDGKMCSLHDFDDKELLVIVFMCNHCPYVQAVWPKLVSLEGDMRNRSVQFVGINANDAESYPDDSFDNMILYARKFAMEFPYLYDETQETAKAYSAVCTPDIFVFDHSRQLVYRGRFDDAGAKPHEGTTHDLRDALDMLLETGKAPEEQYPSMGCSIKWKQT